MYRKEKENDRTKERRKRKRKNFHFKTIVLKEVILILPEYYFYAQWKEECMCNHTPNCSKWARWCLHETHT